MTMNESVLRTRYKIRKYTLALRSIDSDCGHSFSTLFEFAMASAFCLLVVQSLGQHERTALRWGYPQIDGRSTMLLCKTKKIFIIVLCTAIAFLAFSLSMSASDDSIGKNVGGDTIRISRYPLSHSKILLTIMDGDAVMAV